MENSVSDNSRKPPPATRAESKSGRKLPRRVDLRDLLPTSVNVSSAAITGIFVLLLLYTLYFASSLLVPLVFALLLDLMFQPLVDRLARLGLPRGLGALLVIAGLCTTLVSAIWFQTKPALAWLDRAPSVAQQIRIKVEPLRRSAQELQDKTEQVEEIAAGMLNRDTSTREVVLESQTWREQLLDAAERFVTLSVVTLILLYFMLATGRTTARNLLYLLPGFGARRTAIRIGHNLRSHISRYLVTITCLNAVLGLATTLLMWALGMPNPWLWGLLAGVMNFVPYVGATLTTVVIAIVAGISFDELWRIVLAPTSYLLLTSCEGQVISPMLHGKRFAINPVLVFLSMTFWAMLWGAPGIILAVPLLVTFKVVCDQVDSLKPVSLFMTPPATQKKSRTES